MLELKSFERKDKKALRQFLELPYRLYAGNACYVPPLRSELKKLLGEGKGMQLEGGPWTMFLAVKDGRPCGRMLAGVNNVKNAQRGAHEGYFSLFESENDPEVAEKLLSAGECWTREHGAQLITGPVSPTNGDDYRGVLVSGFDRMPAINTPYTQSYYPELLERAGYSKYLDFYAFEMTTEQSAPRAEKMLRYAQKKMGIEIKPFDLSNVGSECRAIHDVFTRSMLSQWNHLEIPSYEQILGEFSALKMFIKSDLIQIARVGEKAVGFVAAIPDYNEVLRRIDGRLNLAGAAKFLYFRSRIKRIRVFMQFVVPEYQKTAVIPSLYSSLYLAFKNGGYTAMEGSTIAEFNAASLANLKGIGFKVDRAYRIFQKPLVGSAD